MVLSNDYSLERTDHYCKNGEKTQRKIQIQQKHVRSLTIVNMFKYMYSLLVNSQEYYRILFHFLSILPFVVSTVWPFEILLIS